MVKTAGNTFEWIEHDITVLGKGGYRIRAGNSLNLLGGELPVGQAFALSLLNSEDALVDVIDDLSKPSKIRKLYDYSLHPLKYPLDNTKTKKIVETGLRDFTLGGYYVGTAQKIYRFKILATGTPDTFQYRTSTDGGTTFTGWATPASGGTITGAIQPIAEGLTVKFETTTGHTANDEWEFWTPMPQNVETEANSLALQTTVAGNAEALTLAIRTTTGGISNILTAEPLDDSETNILTDGPHGIVVNDVIVIDDEKMLVTGLSDPLAPAALDVTRGYDNTAAVTHLDNTPVNIVVMADHRQVFVVKIIFGHASTQNTFKYSTDGGITFDNGGGSTDGDGTNDPDPINIPADPFTHTLRDADNVSYGITITFSAIAGYTTNDAFSFHAFPTTKVPLFSQNINRFLLAWMENIGSSALKNVFFSGASLQTADNIVDAGFTASLLRKGIQSWSTDIIFVGTAYNTLKHHKVGQSDGTASSVSFADGTVEAITPGTLSSISETATYIYKTVGANASTTLVATTTYSDVYTDDRILLATVIAANDSSAGSPSIFPFNGNQGTISAGVISTGAIFADNIAANIITTAQLDFVPNTDSTASIRAVAAANSGFIGSDPTPVTLAGLKVAASTFFMGTGNFKDDDTPFFVRGVNGLDGNSHTGTAGDFSLGNKFVWDESASTLDITGTITGSIIRTTAITKSGTGGAGNVSLSGAGVLLDSTGIYGASATGTGNLHFEMNAAGNDAGMIRVGNGLIIFRDNGIHMLTVADDEADLSSGASGVIRWYGTHGSNTSRENYDAGSPSVVMGQIANTNFMTSTITGVDIMFKAGPDSLLKLEGSDTGTYGLMETNSPLRIGYAGLGVTETIDVKQDYAYGARVTFVDTAITGSVPMFGDDLIDITASSARKYKDNIKDMKVDTEKLYDLNPVTFDWKGRKAFMGKSFGYIAEEMDKLFPELVGYDPKENTPESIEYRMLSVLLLEEIKNLNDRIKKLEKK